MKKLLVVYVVWSNCNLVYGSTSHQRIQSKGIELVGVRSFLNGVSWNSCRAACVNPEWNSNEAPIDRNDLMIMNNDRVKEEEGTPTGFRINSYMQGGVGKAAGQCSGDGDWWWRGEAKEKPRENGSISIKGIKRKTKTKKEKKNPENPWRRDSVVRFDLPPAWHAELPFYTPLIPTSTTKVDGSKATELIKASLFPNVLYIFRECTILLCCSASIRWNKCMWCTVFTGKRRLEILDMDCASWASLVYAALPAAHPDSTVHASLRFMGVGRRE